MVQKGNRQKQVAQSIYKVSYRYKVYKASCLYRVFQAAVSPSATFKSPKCTWGQGGNRLSPSGASSEAPLFLPAPTYWQPTNKVPYEDPEP